AKATVSANQAARLVRDNSVSIDSLARSRQRPRLNLNSKQGDADSDCLCIAGGDQSFDRAGVDNRAAAYRHPFAVAGAAGHREKGIARSDKASVGQVHETVYIDAVASAIADDGAVVDDGNEFVAVDPINVDSRAVI